MYVYMCIYVYIYIYIYNIYKYIHITHRFKEDLNGLLKRAAHQRTGFEPVDTVASDRLKKKNSKVRALVYLPYKVPM
jgi:hypothetical protein